MPTPEVLLIRHKIKLTAFYGCMELYPCCYCYVDQKQTVFQGPLIDWHQRKRVDVKLLYFHYSVPTPGDVCAPGNLSVLLTFLNGAPKRGDASTCPSRYQISI